MGYLDDFSPYKYAARMEVGTFHFHPYRCAPLKAAYHLGIYSSKQPFSLVKEFLKHSEHTANDVSDIIKIEG